MATTRGVSLARVGRRCAFARVGVSRASVVKSARARAVRAVKTRAAREGEEDSAAAKTETETETASYKTSVTDDPAFTAAASTVEPVMTPSVTTEGMKSRAFVDAPPESVQREQVRSFLYPGEDELPDDVSMTIWEHLEELRERALVSAVAVGALILVCFCFAKDLTIFLEEPVASQGVRFLQLGPGEYFFTTVKVAGYTGLLAGAPVVLYEAIAYVLPGLTLNERKTLGPIVLGSSVLFYGGIVFAYYVLVPAALKFFVGYADGAVESLWSIDQYFEFVLVLLFSTWLSRQGQMIQRYRGPPGRARGALRGDRVRLARSHAQRTEDARSHRVGFVGALLRRHRLRVLRARAGGVKILCRIRGRGGGIAVVDRSVL